MSQKLIWQITLSMIPGVGGITAKKLISYCGGVEAVFKEKKPALMKIPGIGSGLAEAITSHKKFDRAEQELTFIKKNKIRALFFLDKDYPARLKNCDDGPVVLFVKGNADLNAEKVIGIVGTRSVTGYGREKCREIVEGIAPHQALIVSGLAYGVDACAHKYSLDNGLMTAAVLGHGLDKIYPPLHFKLAERITEQGALVSDFLTLTRPDKENFPKRNRIIAGLCDALVVVEAASTGGALITANIANTYNRDVFAVPGRTSDTFSAGCNNLIKTHKANLLTSAADLEYIMGWDKAGTRKAVQQALFVQLSADEETMVAFLRKYPESGIDYIVANAGFPVSKTSALLLNLEFKGVVKTLPGKTFKLTLNY